MEYDARRVPVDDAVYAPSDPDVGVEEDLDDGSGSDSGGERGTEEDEDEDEDGSDASLSRPPAEVAALCWCAGGVGVARFLCAECRIEVFEVPVCMVAGEAVRRGAGGSGGTTGGAAPSSGQLGSAPPPRSRRTQMSATGSCGDVRIVAHEDIPPSLLWLVRYLHVHRPQVLLPHTGSEALGDLIALVAEQTPVEVIRLSAATAFCASAAVPRLAAMYPAQESELAARFHAEKTAMMCSMAALLQFVAAVQSNVADVVERDVLHALYLDDACAEALQITRAERHPSSGHGRGRAKEGLSLRGLLSVTQSSPGRAMLRQWIALPCCDVAEIEARQSVVAFFANPLRHDLAARLRVALHKVRSTTHIFTLMRSGRARHTHYASLYHTTRGAIAVQELLATVAHEVGRLYVLLQSIDVEPLRAIAASLATAVAGVAARRRDACGAGSGAAQSRDSDYPVTPELGPLAAHPPGSRVGGVRIRDGVDAVLDELRVRFHELRLSLQAKAEAAFAELPWTLRAGLSLRCVYTVPHGYLLCVPAAELVALLPVEDTAGADAASAGEEDEAGEEDDVRHAPTTPAERVRSYMAASFGWRLHHATVVGELCFKSAAMEELDAWVGDLQRRAQQREEQVRRSLDTSLLYNSLHLLRPTRALGELDCLLSFARVSAQEGWSRPEMVSPTVDSAAAELGAEEGILEIEGGWHPVLPRHVGMQQLVPFTLHLRTSAERVCLVLGVNGSGKSVLMCAVAHIVFLAHLGCHVPAAAARVSLVNGIFAPSSAALSACSAARRSAWSVGDAAASLPGSFYAECVALHRVLHFVAGQQRALRMARSGGSAAGQTCAAGRALVLLDEFGRGTAPEDACALLQATLQYFAEGGEGGGAEDRRGGHGVPLVLCATHLVEMLDAGATAGVSRAPDSATPVRAAAEETGLTGPATLCRPADTPLPLEWVKVYEMETHITYRRSEEEEERGVGGSCRSRAAAGDARLQVLDVTPTYLPVCRTPHPGWRRRADWAEHLTAHLDAGPAIGRQCGLDAALLEHWQSALQVLRRAS